MKDDLISRQAAINAKQEFRNPNVVRDTEARTAYDRTYANGWNDCNSAWINAIKALPSAQPELPSYVAEIEEEYQKAVNSPYIHKPLAKALYEVWKKHDMEDAERRTDE